MKAKLLLGLLLVVPCWAGEETKGDAKAGEPVFMMRPIGRVQNVKGKPVELQIKKEYLEGLDGLEHCSHVMVLWWFDKNDTPEKRKTLKVHPCGDQRNPLTGVFATRSPRRPNLVAVTTCKVLSVKDGVVTVDVIDAFDGTPIIDLKCAGTRDFALKGSPPPVPR
jgi:tRNA-Thr(GGU) m(6)t(6)A37 methyltransferase TsaA